MKNIWNNSYLNCSYRWKWRMIIPVNFQFKQLERRSLKTSGLQWDSNPWPLWTLVRCSTNWAMKPHIESKVNLSSYLPVRSEMIWSRDPYSFFLKVVSWASIPKNMLALAKFWLPFQKWRIIGKKRWQNGYMLKNLVCVFLLTSYDASLQYM